MNTVSNHMPAQEIQAAAAVATLPNNSNAGDNMYSFNEIHPLTDRLIRSQKSVKIDSIVYYMMMMMVALVSLTVYFYRDLL